MKMIKKTICILRKDIRGGGGGKGQKMAIFPYFIYTENVLT